MASYQNDIGAGSGGGGGAAAPPGRLLPPLRLLFWTIILLRERWFLGQKDAPNPVKTIFLENAGFSGNITLQFR